MLRTGTIPFIRESLYYVTFLKSFASEIISLGSDVISSSKMELQELQTWDPVDHTGIYEEVSLTVAEAAGEIDSVTFICPFL